MSGSDKRKLLVIGKSKQPRGFPSNHFKLTVFYRRSANAWVTSQIFTEYLPPWDRTLRLQERSVLQLVDNCTAHPAGEGLILVIAIRLEFFPPSTTATLQPCDQGIIRNLKCHYRTALNRLIISELDADDSKSATDIARNITTLRAIYLMFAAWTNVTATTITNCFRKAGFASVSTVTETGSEAQADAPPDDTDHFSTPVNMSDELFNEFIDLDSQEPVSGELEDKAIVESVKHRKMEASQQQSQEDVEEDDDLVSVTMPSSLVLMQSLNNIRCFMEFNGLISGTRSETITKNIQANVSTKTVQTSITHFLPKKKKKKKRK